MEKQYTHKTYLSPLTWRYGSPEMRELWSEEKRRLIWRRIWVALAEAQEKAGLVSAVEVADLRAHADQIDLERADAIESQIHHDVMAEVRTFAEQCPVGGRIIHLGATSMDVVDNADAVRIRQSLDLILERLTTLLTTLAEQIERWANTPVIAWTHLQPAEPTTLGYRLAQYGQDLKIDAAELRRVRNGIRGKGFKGAVGTSASYAHLLEGTGMTPTEMENRVMASLGLESFYITTQTYPRKQDWLVMNALAGLASSLYKFAFDLRLLQSPPVGELAEPFGKKQVGSSAMPFKRNPINAENMNSMARLVAALPRVAWDNAAHSLLERTLDDSANSRIIFPEAFLATDELLRRAQRIIGDLRVNESSLARNLAKYGVFAATEQLLMALGRAGADRQEMHELIRLHSLEAWQAVESGQSNPLQDRLANDDTILKYLPRERVLECMDGASYVGDAPQRARALAAELRELRL
ncbi:MAG: adenylosuccinate lyase [Anaerolineales bacterium]|nr:adenylosuccinate lyase [Anaerolineales bacterium]